MPKPKSIYRRLGGQGATLTYYARLFLGPDHLLQAASTGYSETYKRFYFQDIQAIMIRKTDGLMFWTFFWLLPALAFAISALALDGQTAALLWIIAGVLLLAPMINLLLGPTCVCHIRTAVQTERLPSLKRLRKTRKILAQIKPLIEAVQGKLSADDSAARRAGVRPSPGAASVKTGGVGSSPDALEMSKLAAPEDGRTPGSSAPTSHGEMAAPPVIGGELPPPEND